MTRKTALVLIAIIALALCWFLSRAYQEVSGAVPLVKEPPPLPGENENLPFSVPEGFAVSVFSAETPGARVLTRDPKGTLVVSLTDSGKIVALPDFDNDNKADSVVTILADLNKPHGLAFDCPYTGNASADQDACVLYVAETDELNVYSYDADTFSARYQKTLTSLPTDGGHYTRSLFPLDETLLVSVGSSCNVCEEEDARRAKVLAIDISGASDEPTDYATGLRNMVFMARHPVTGHMWGTEMGRDLLGDDTPPDEVNVLRLRGHFGWPYCYGKNIQDTTFEEANPGRCQKMDPSHIDIPAHSAPLGLAFVPEEGWPEDYWHDLLVAYHGSWNRSEPTGYKVVRFDLDPLGQPTGEVEDFMTGFRNESGDVIGRPVGLLAEPGGTLWITDDRAGAVYRVFRTSIE